MRAICAALAFLFAWNVFTAGHTTTQPTPTVTTSEVRAP